MAPSSVPSSVQSSTFILRPAVIIVPGGGYTDLAPHEGEPIARWANTLGYVAFVLRYRVLPRYPWPAPLDDLQAAVAYLQSNESNEHYVGAPDVSKPGAPTGTEAGTETGASSAAAPGHHCQNSVAAARWGVDPDRIAVIGFSAGAHLAAQLLQTTPRAVEGAVPQQSRDQVSSHRPFRAMVLVYPPAMDAGDIRTVPESLLPPDRRAGEQMTTVESTVARQLLKSNFCPQPLPTYVVASTNDTMLPPAVHADLVVADLRLAGMECTYLRGRFGGHGFGLHRKWAIPCARWLHQKLEVDNI